MTEPISEVERLSRKLEVASAILLGICTIGAAFAAFQSTLWNGNTAATYTQAVIKYGDANREYLRGAMDVNFDSMVYLESLRGNPKTADDIERMKSVELDNAVAWADKEYARRQAAMKPGQEAALEKSIERKWEAWEAAAEGSPERDALLREIRALEASTTTIAFLESPHYQKAKRLGGDTLAKEGDQKMEEASQANKLGDSFTLLTVFFTIGLFFAGLAAVLKVVSTRLTFVGLSTLVFVGTLVRMFFLKFAF